jgi:F-type H+-transporting ATPase subunit delta
MSAYRLATRYAKSLFDLSLEKNQLEEVNTNVRNLQSIIKSSREFRLLLKSPIVNPDKKMAIMHRLFESGFNTIMGTFLDLLVRKRREEYLPPVLEEFVTLYNGERKIARVKLVTSVKVDDELVKRIRSLFLDLVHVETVELENIIDESIVGGFVLNYEDRKYDASIARQLEAMDEQFLTNLFVRRYS